MLDVNHPVRYFGEKVASHLELLAISVALFFAPIVGILITVLVFIMLDTFMGIWKSRKKKVPITSRGLSALISKTLLYEITVLCTYFVDYYILNSITSVLFSQELVVTKIIALTLLSIEAVSINENFKQVRGVSLWDAMKKMVSRAKEVKEDVDQII